MDFVLLPLIDIQTPGAAVPPAASRITDYGLVFDRVRKRIVYAPAVPHGNGLSWSWDGSQWSPFTTLAVQSGSIAQTWRAVWDERRKAVVAWSWDHRDGPIGVVLDPDATRPRVLVANAAFKSYRGPCEVEVLTGDLP